MICVTAKGIQEILTKGKGIWAKFRGNQVRDA